MTSTERLIIGLFSLNIGPVATPGRRHFDTPAIERLKRDLTPLLSQPAERVEMYEA